MVSYPPFFLLLFLLLFLFLSKQTLQLSLPPLHNVYQLQYFHHWKLKWTVGNAQQSIGLVGFANKLNNALRLYKSYTGVGFSRFSWNITNGQITMATIASTAKQQQQCSISWRQSHIRPLWPALPARTGLRFDRARKRSEVESRNLNSFPDIFRSSFVVKDV